MRKTFQYGLRFMLVFVAICMYVQGYSQEKTSTVTKQLWLDYNPNFRLSNRAKMYVPFGYRTNFPNFWDRVFIEPQVKYDWPRLVLKNLKYKEQLVGGLGVFYTFNKYDHNRLELRPYQGYSISAPNRIRFVIKHYIRLEERFELDMHNWENTFGLRFRYIASVTFKFQGDLWEKGKGFYIPLSGEFFWNLIGTKQFNDKFRFTPGIGKTFSDNWKAAFFVGYNYTRNTIKENFHTNDIIFRFRVYHTLKRDEE